MQTTGNTILVTGGGSGIGRALAERFHDRGNQVIIAGRRLDVLNRVAAGRDGMATLELDVADAGSVNAAVAELGQRFPAMNVLINNAGISRPEDLTAAAWDFDLAEATIATNVTGVLRLTGALLAMLRQKSNAVVITTTSGLAYVPLASHPTYSATKAFLHSWLQSLRHQLRDTGIEILEMSPPYVQTELGGPQQLTDPYAMPLDAYADEIMTLLETGDTPDSEVLVQRVMGYRMAEREGRYAETFAQGNP
ncbi:SDR family oxidoreductase [Sphingomonas sp. R86520]|uniref:SDR family oxidoreductase n=1 Tax=Sphingomonas sp. R86520 TaxID=3093859 RepID=UPI0036D241D7